MGAFGPPPVRGPAPTYPPYKKQKMAKNQAFLAFYIFAPYIPTPPPNKKNNLVQPLEKFAIWFLRLVKISVV